MKLVFGVFFILLFFVAGAFWIFAFSLYEKAKPSLFEGYPTGYFKRVNHYFCNVEKYHGYLNWPESKLDARALHNPILKRARMYYRISIAIFVATILCVLIVLLTSKW